MIGLTWNFRGLENSRIVQTLKWLVKDKCPHLVFLMETKCNKARIEIIKRVINFDNCLVVDSVGRSGGLAMMWKSTIDVQVQSYSQWHISLVAKDPVIDKEWLLTGFYGHPYLPKRTSSWNLLKNLNQGMLFPWRFQQDHMSKWKTRGLF